MYDPAADAWCVVAEVPQWRYGCAAVGAGGVFWTRVHQTVGNRSAGQTGSGLVRYETGSNSKFKFEFKKMKIPKKILKYFKVRQI